MEISLCLLTWNELEGCKHDLPLLPLGSFQEVFTIDNGSTDGTIEFLEANHIRVVQQKMPTYNGAYMSAFLECNSDYLVFYHPKGSINPEDCLKFRQFFERGYDIVIGSRLVRGSRNEEDDCLIKPRKWFVISVAILSSILWRKKGPIIWDVLHGFRGYRKSAYFSINPQERGVFIDLESIVRAYKKGLRCAEFPVHEAARLKGATHFRALPVGGQILKYMWFEIWRKD